MNGLSPAEIVFYCVLVVCLRNRAVMDFVGRVTFGLVALAWYVLIIAACGQFLAVIFHLR